MGNGEGGSQGFFIAGLAGLLHLKKKKNFFLNQLQNHKEVSFETCAVTPRIEFPLR